MYLPTSVEYSSIEMFNYEYCFAGWEILSCAFCSLREHVLDSEINFIASVEVAKASSFVQGCLCMNEKFFENSLTGCLWGPANAISAELTLVDITGCLGLVPQYQG